MIYVFFCKLFSHRKAIVMLLVNQTFPLFKPPYALYFFTCAFLHFGTFCLAGGLAMFLPEILNRLSKQEGGLRVCDVMQMETEQSNSTEVSIWDISTRFEPIFLYFLQICDDSMDSSVFIDSLYVGVGYTIGFAVLASTIKSLGRRIVFGQYRHI